VYFISESRLAVYSRRLRQTVETRNAPQTIALFTAFWIRRPLSYTFSFFTRRPSISCWRCVVGRLLPFSGSPSFFPFFPFFSFLQSFCNTVPSLELLAHWRPRLTWLHCSTVLTRRPTVHHFSLVTIKLHWVSSFNGVVTRLHCSIGRPDVHD